MDLTSSFQVPDYIRTLSPYVPGKPIEETQREFNIRRVVKLASNENPLGPSPKALIAVKRALTETHRYPDGSAFSLKQALSRHLEVDSSSLIIGNGSNEVIDFLVRTFCLPGDVIVTSQGAFIAYKLCAQVHGVRTLETALTADLRFDLEEILERVRLDESVRMVFIANPNNPTGTYVTDVELELFLTELAKIRRGSVIAVLDYAYWEYVTAADLPDPTPYVSKFSNVVVLRTFSKVYGLAGFRVGYAVAPAPLMGHLEKVRQPFNVNSLALIAAEAALSDRSFVLKARKINQKGLVFWKKALGELGVPFWNSQGNFLLAHVQKGLNMTGPEVYNACLRKGAIFRAVANYGMPGALRISIGTEDENRLGARILREIAQAGLSPAPKPVKGQKKKK